MRALVFACLAAGCAATASTSGPPLPLGASSNAQTVWALGSPGPKLPATTKPAGKRTIWVTTTACLFPGDGNTRAPAFDAKRCVGILERVAVDADVSDADAVRVEKLSIESAALKLEALLPASDVGGESGD